MKTKNIKIKNIKIKRVESNSNWAWELIIDNPEIMLLMSEFSNDIYVTSLYCTEEMMDMTLYLNTKRMTEENIENAIKFLKEGKKIE